MANSVLAASGELLTGQSRLIRSRSSDSVTQLSLKICILCSLVSVVVAPGELWPGTSAEVTEGGRSEVVVTAASEVEAEAKVLAAPLA